MEIVYNQWQFEHWGTVSKLCELPGVGDAWSMCLDLESTQPKIYPSL